MEITLTGATGFVGSALIHKLSASGHGIHAAGRQRPGALQQGGFSQWPSTNEPFPQSALAGVDAVIHLAGEPVAQRWTSSAKRSILASRVEGTRALVEAIARSDRRPQTLVSASAIGYYGDRGDERLKETSAAGGGFLSEVCVAWENAARKAESLGVRVVCVRIGVVLGTGGGALQKMLPPFRFGLGGRIGSGRQWMSWIHIQDLVDLILHGLQTPALAGPLNATAPAPARNADFTRALARVLHRPAFFVVPPIALRLAYGEMSEMLTGGQYVEPAAALASGYRFQHVELEQALRQILHRA